MMLPNSIRNAEYSYADVGLRYSSAQQQNIVALNPPVRQATENDDGLERGKGGGTRWKTEMRKRRNSWYRLGPGAAAAISNWGG